MESILGKQNNFFDYVLVLVVYGMMLLLMKYGNGKIELSFRKNFQILFIFWSFAMFGGNYLFFLSGIMSFLPWLNNLIHSFVWVGLCLGFLYAGTYRMDWYMQFALFAIFSFIVKVFENLILGTWGYDNYLGIESRYSYIIVMSIADGFYPLISNLLLRFISKFYTGIYLE